MIFVKYFLSLDKHCIPFRPRSALFLKKEVLHQSTRSGSQLFKSLLHISNGQILDEYHRLQKGTKFDHLFLNTLYCMSYSAHVPEDAVSEYVQYSAHCHAQLTLTIANHNFCFPDVI